MQENKPQAQLQLQSPTSDVLPPNIQTFKQKILRFSSSHSPEGQKRFSPHGPSPATRVVTPEFSQPRRFPACTAKWMGCTEQDTEVVPSSEGPKIHCWGVWFLRRTLGCMRYIRIRWGIYIYNCIYIPWNRKMDIKVIKLKGNLHFFGFMSSLGGRVHLFLKHQYCRKMPCGGWNRMEWWNSFEHLGYFQASCSRSTFRLYDELLPIKSDENNMRSWGSDKTWQNLIHS